MGLTHLTVEVANPARPSRRVRKKMLVDSGAAYSVVDGTTLERLGIRRTGTRSFILADGSEITRSTGTAVFRFRGSEAGSTIIFGEPGDATLIGVVTLEEFGLILDPMRRELRPMPMSLMPLS
jgi:predicted aspartyl protease